MDYRLNAEDEEYRRELRAWLEKTFPKDEPLPKLDTLEDEKKAYRNYQRKLFEGGYAGIRHSKKYGGQEGTMIQEMIVSEEIAPYGRVRAAGINSIGMGMALPTINAVGTDEQKDMFLRKMLDGTHVWVQAFSEPNAGSDVASTSTRAVKKGDDYIVNGQKIWTTSAQYADWSLVLVRTNPDKPKHRGLSYLLIDLKSPGVEIRPIKQMTGASEFNEIFFEDVFVPGNMLVGHEDEGWGIALTTLMFERVMGDLSMANTFGAMFTGQLEMARGLKVEGRPVLEDPMFRQKMAKCYSDIMVLKYSGLRNFSKVFGGGVPGPEGSIGKLLWSTLQVNMSELSMEMQGPYNQLMKGSPRAIADGLYQYSFLSSKGSVIAAGTTEIMKNIIGERVLGLPKDMARAAITERS
ncbi:MAG: acyl-CoA dehydrogenase family protein [Candidatus Adiutricales bacterium]